MPDLISWLPTLSHVLYLWTCLAYIVAFLRTRRGGWFVGAICTPLFGLILGLALIRWMQRGADARVWLSLLGWASYLVLLLLASWKAGHEIYGGAIQVLLLRAPWVGPAGPARWPWTRPAVLLFLPGTLLLGLANAGSMGVEQCGWLDIALRRSECLGALISPGSSESVTFSPDGALLAIGGGQHVAELWQVRDRRLGSTLGRLDRKAQSVAFAPDGALIATSSDDFNVRLWRASDRSLVRTLVVDGPKDTITRIRFSPDGQFVAAHAVKGLGENDIWLWRVADGSLIRHVPAGGWGMAFSPDSALLLMQDNHGSIVLARVSDGVVVRTLDEPPIGQELDFSPDGRMIAGFQSPDGILALWRAADGKLLRTIRTPRTWLFSVAFSPDSTLLAVGTGDGEVQLWGTDDGQLRKVLKHGSIPVVSMAFSPDGRTLAAGTIGDYAYLWRVPQ